MHCTHKAARAVQVPCYRAQAPTKSAARSCMARHSQGDSAVASAHLLQCAAAAAVAVVLQLAPLLPSQASDLGMDPLSINSIKDAVQRDFVEGQYYVTGKLTPSLYEPDCLFIDPTVRVRGVGPYTKAVAALFDPATSKADLLSIEATDPHSITLRWRLEGKLQLGGLSVKPYTGTTVYHVDHAGLIDRHEETWDISALDALVSTFLPGFGAPPAPPVSN